MNEFIEAIFPDRMLFRLIEAQDHRINHLETRINIIMANLADLTTAVNNYQSAVTAKLASDQSIIAADTQEITDLHNSPIPDELVASLNAATAALTPATTPTDPTKPPVDGTTP